MASGAAKNNQNLIGSIAPVRCRNYSGDF